MVNEFVSIVIPVYNTEDYLEECLNSVLAQTYQNWECIIVDDGSTDNTKSIAERYAKMDARFIVFSQKNGGASKARNFGIDRAKGDYVAFLDSDDVWFSHHLSHLMDKIYRCGVDFAYGRSYLIENNIYTQKFTKSQEVKFGVLTGKGIIAHFLKHNDVDTPAVVCKKQVLLECNKFSFDKNAEDLYAWLSILFNGRIFYSSEEVTLYVRIRDNSTSSVDRSCTKEVLEIMTLFKDKIQNLSLNYDDYFKYWAERYVRIDRKRSHYIKVIEYIHSLEPKYFPFLNKIAKYLPRKVLKIIVLRKLSK